MYNNYYNKVLAYIYIINYLITESEVVTEKYQTEASYWPSDSEVNTVGRGLRFSRNDRTVEVIKLFIIWHQKKAKKPKLAQRKWSLYIPWALRESNALQFSDN